MRTVVPIAILAMALAFIPIAAAGQAGQMAPAPLPTQIHAGKKVFISNAGSEGRLFPGIFSGQPDRTYNQLYAAIKNWGRYELALTPAEADLVFEVRFGAPVGGVVIMNGGGGSTLDPQLRLEIQDPKTHTVLWGFIEHVQPGTAVGKNFDQAMTDLVSEVKRIAG